MSSKSDQEHIRQLKGELASLRDLAARHARRIAELEAQLAKGSHNSSRPSRQRRAGAPTATHPHAQR